MLMVFVAVAVLLAVGLALGRAPLFRVLAPLLALLGFVLIAVPWLLLMAVVEVERRVRPLGQPLEGAAVVVLCLLPPLLATGLTLRWLRRRGRPRFLWRLADRPATLSLPGILLVQASVFAETTPTWSPSSVACPVSRDSFGSIAWRWSASVARSSSFACE